MLFKLFHAAMPFFDGPNDGGSGGAGAPAVAPPPPAPAAAPTAATPPPPVAVPATQANGAEQKMFSREYVQELREEAAGLRVKLREQGEAWKAVGPDPAAAAAALASATGTIRQLKIDGALNNVFTKHGVVPDLTRAVLATVPDFGKLNPDDAEFTKALDAMVKATADKHPQLKAGQAPPPPAPPRSGLPLSGGGQANPSQLSREHLKAMTSEQIADAVKKGELDQVLGRTP
jgi:hypothetical protein